MLNMDDLELRLELEKREMAVKRGHDAAAKGESQYDDLNDEEYMAHLRTEMEKLGPGAVHAFEDNKEETLKTWRESVRQRKMIAEKYVFLRVHAIMPELVSLRKEWGENGPLTDKQYQVAVFRSAERIKRDLANLGPEFKHVKI